jgi:hypothetical protein
MEHPLIFEQFPIGLFMNKPICIAGQGRSLQMIKQIPDDFDKVLLCNYDQQFISKVLEDQELTEIFRRKECILFCNASKSGFNKMAFDNFNVKACVVNRVKPTENWELWTAHKKIQTRGVMFNNDKIPPVEKDLPYMYKWRGPAPISPDGSHVPIRNVNFPEMKINDDMPIQHMSEDIEIYLFEPTRDRLETNMGLYFTSLYSIVQEKADHLYFAGIDFYDSIGDGEAWKFHKEARLKMEGEHMKILLNDYLSRYFPKVKFEFFTHANFTSQKDNVIIHRGQE